MNFDLPVKNIEEKVSLENPAVTKLVGNRRVTLWDNGYIFTLLPATTSAGMVDKKTKWVELRLKNAVVAGGGIRVKLSGLWVAGQTLFVRACTHVYTILFIRVVPPLRG
ncbi:MAG: hypothetical protein HZB37_09520 [Planctomycetes bacterium]|nr:hypothetical protein [Planctomycetota bacterium]